MSAKLRFAAAHNYLFGDRHQKLYPHFNIYLIGDGRIPSFFEKLEARKSVQEICEWFELEHRADVWFATLLAYLHKRDGIYQVPKIDLEIPSELLPRMELFEQQWQRRNDPPPPSPWHYTPPEVPHSTRPIFAIEEEIVLTEEMLKTEEERLRPVLIRIIERKREELAKRQMQSQNATP